MDGPRPSLEPDAIFHPTGVTLNQLRERGRAVVRMAGRQILLIAAEERLFALANRCPHEGYPLSEGTLAPGCVLTCDWHNWKFELATGAALIGRDPTRTYPVEVRAGEIFLDVRDPSAAARRIRAFAGLDAGLADHDRTRIAREAARLEHAGFDAREALAHALISRGEHLEGGMTHAHAAAADWLALAERAPTADKRLAAILEPLGHIAWDTLGAGHFPYAVGVRAWDAGAFAEAVEAEDEAAAMALVAGAIGAGYAYADLRPSLSKVALAHYADFGHSVIYVFKAGQLIERLGDAVTMPVVRALVRQLVQARREDRLPEFRGYARALETWSGLGDKPALAKDFTSLTVNAALKRALASSGRPTNEILDALLGAAAWSLLHFDLTFDTAADRPIADNANWLDFTHALTFANAARHLCMESPELWPRALLQLALFIGRNRKYVNGSLDVSSWEVEDSATFLTAELDLLYDHGIAEPIIACHRLKVLFALEDELAAAPDAPWKGAMCAAVNRYLNTPAKRHHGLRIARQARAFIARGG